MIEKFFLEGYRLLDRLEIDLGRLTVVIGANSTGKSSLLDALSLITASVDWPIEDVVSALGGLWSILNYGRDCDELRWQITFAKSSDHPIWSKMPLSPNARCVYEARLGRDLEGKVKPRYECLRYASPQPGHSTPFKMLEVENERAKVFDSKTGKLTDFDQPNSLATNSIQNEKALEAAVQKASLVLAQMRFPNQFPIPTWVRAYFSTFCFYTGFDVGRLASVRIKAAEIKAQTALSSTGENLGTVLHEILTRHDFRNAASELREFLNLAYPQIESISAETTYGGEARVLVRIREFGTRRATEMSEISDGMLRFLLLCTALLNPAPPGLIAIDEPETGLHPKLLPILAAVIRSAAERTQVLITTHSPQLLNSFSIDDIAVLRREGTQAIWHRPSCRETLKQMLDSQIGGTVGEVFASGELEALS